MAEVKEIEKQVEQKEGDFNSRNTRMDNDFDMWKLIRSAYDRAIDAKTKKHGSEIDIISNKPRTFCDNVQSILSSSEMQIQIRMAEAEGEDKREDMGKLERMFYFLLQRGYERLERILYPPLREQLIWYSLVRGWVAGKFLTYKAQGNVIPDYMAWDPRWVTYEVGKDDLLWTAYKTFRSKATLLSEYGYEEKPSIIGKLYQWILGKEEQDNVVIDYWKYEGENSITNTVVCGGITLKETTEYKLPSMPILIMPVATRPPVSGSSGVSEVEGYGEGILAPVRDIIGIRNRLVSMWASHGNLLFNQPLLHYKKSGGGSEIPQDVFFGEPGSVIDLVLDEDRIEASPMKEISPTLIDMLRWANSEIEEGTLPDISRIGTPPESGTRASLAQEAGNRVFNPQLRNLNRFYAGILRLIEEQLLINRISVDVKFEQKRKYYDYKVTPIDLKKSHKIEVEFTARTQYSQMYIASLADMLKRAGVPDSFLFEHIYKFPDPKGLQDQALIELYEHSPEGIELGIISALGRTKDKEYMEKGIELMRDYTRRKMAQTAPPEGAPPPPEVPTGTPGAPPVMPPTPPMMPPGAI